MATFSIGLRVVPQYKVEHCHETSSLVPSCAAPFPEQNFRLLTFSDDDDDEKIDKIDNIDKINVGVALHTKKNTRQCLNPRVKANCLRHETCYRHLFAEPSTKHGGNKFQSSTYGSVSKPIVPL